MGICRNAGEVRILVGFCWSFGLGSFFLIKAGEGFHGGGSRCRKYSQDRRVSTEGGNGNTKANNIP